VRATYNRVPNAIKNRLIKMVLDDGKDIKTASADLDINYSTARSIIATAKKDETQQNAETTNTTLSIPVPRGRTVTVGLEHTAFIERLLEECPGITLKLIRLKLFERFGIFISVTTIHRKILEIGITLKTGRNVLEKIDMPETIAIRAAFASLFNRESPIDKRKCVFIE
jgi:transposase